MTNNCDLYIQNTRTRVLLVLFSALMLATLFGSCDRKPSATTPNPKIALRYVHDVVLDYPLDRLFEKRTELLSHFYDKNDNLFFANLNQRDSVLDIHDWEHNHTSRSLDISGVMREFELQEASIALIIAERFFLFGQVPIDYTDRFTDFKDQRVVEIDSSGQLIEAYSLYKLMGCDSLDDGCPFRFLLDFLPDHRPVYANNKAYIGKVVSNPGFDFMGQDGFKKLMTLEAISTQDFVLDFSNGGFHVLGHTGKSPSIYKEGFFDGSYGTSSRCVNSEGDVIYSSQSVDSVFVYSEKGLVSKHHFRASQHITSIDPVDWSDHNDYRAFTKQAIENPNYWGIYYDPYRKFTIRVFMEPIPYEDGVKVNGYEDKPTWLVVADSAYNIIGEIPVERDLQPVNMYFTKDHVIIEKYHEDGIKTDKPVFAVYEWQRVD